MCVCNKFLSFWLVNCPASGPGNCSGTPFIYRYGLSNAKLGCQIRLSCATLRFFILTDQCYILICGMGHAVHNLWWKTTLDGRQPLMEDPLWQKTTFDRRGPLMRKMIYDGRQPLKEDNLGQKTRYDGRLPLTEDNLWQKTIFDRRGPLTWKTTYDGRQPLTEYNL